MRFSAAGDSGAPDSGRLLGAVLLFFILPLFSPTAQAGEGVRLADATGGRREIPEAAAAPLRLSFTGDLMAHSINYEMQDYDKIYKGLEGLLLEDDLTFGNVEFPMDPDRPMASFPSFNIHTPYLEAFIGAGLDVFSIANNHTADIGTESLIATVKAATELTKESLRPLYFSGASPVPLSDPTAGTPSETILPGEAPDDGEGFPSDYSGFSDHRD